MKDVLIIGPIGEFGGTELEVGFIAHALQSNYNVSVCSTSSLTIKSQVYNFNSNQTVVTLNSLLYKKHFLLRQLANLSALKNRNTNKQAPDFVNNKLAKQYLNYNKKRIDVLTTIIATSDIVFIVGQLSSLLISDIIEIANKANKPIVFRTTTTIKKNMVPNPNVFKMVDVFIHHSNKNSNNFESHYFKHSNIIIDQCAFNENELLKLPLKQKRIKKFIVLSRLSKEKQIDMVIKAFNNTFEDNDCLYIFGDGEERARLETLKDNSNIIFKGYIDHSDIVSVFKDYDCLIISSLEEAGPITGLEAMASGVPIISTKVGAMEARLKDDCFWYDGTQKALEKKIIEIKKLTEKEVYDISKKVREIYKVNHKITVIQRQYLDVVDNIFNT